MKYLSIILPTVLFATVANAQNVVDAARFSETTLSGTARYRSMGGAFGAVGGDATAMTDNPAGLGIYRGTSEVSFTPQVTTYNTTTKGDIEKDTRKTGFSMSNLTYVISFNTEDAGELINFNIGVGFNHSEGVDRKYRSYLGNPRSSFGAYLANQANNFLVNTGRYNNPGYLETDRPANMIEMGYNSYALDDARDASGNLAGVCSFDQAEGLASTQTLSVREKTRMDEYNISAAANWSNMFYGGVTLSIVDFNSIVESELNEDYVNTTSYTDYYNNLESKGSGVNIKLGMLFKPVDAWRIGLAYHTPTWMYMKDIYDGAMYTDADGGKSRTGSYEYKYRINTPWELQFSTAYVIGNRGLVSFEYDMKDFSSANYKEDKSNDQDLLDVTNDVIKDYMQPQHIFKVGGEFRATPRFSIRAGYQYRTSPFKKEVFDEMAGRSWSTTDGSGAWGDDNETLFSSSTKPNYSITDDQHYLCLGCGWKGHGWFIDLAFVDQFRKDKIAAFPTTDALMGFDYGNAVMSASDVDGAVTANHIDMKSNIMSWDVTFGFKF